MTDVNKALNDLLKLCQHPFVSDFLFKTDPIADITMLTSPVQPEQKISARIAVDGMQISPSPTQQPWIDYFTEFYYASIPAFSINALTLGFCTTHPIASFNPGHKSACTMGTPTCNRFVRCDSSAQLLVLMEEPLTDTLELDCVTQINTRSRTRLFARFSATAFHAARKRCAHFSAHSLRPALQYLTISHERRDCMVCGSSGMLPCPCALPLLRPEYPLDFRNEKRNMTVHTGSFEGGARVKLFSKTFEPVYPLDISSARIRTTIHGLDDAALHTVLIHAAVQRRLSDLRLQPGGSVSVPAPLAIGDVSRTYLSVAPDFRSPSPQDTVPSEPLVSDLRFDDSCAVDSISLVAGGAPEQVPLPWREGDELGSLIEPAEAGVLPTTQKIVEEETNPQPTPQMESGVDGHGMATSHSDGEWSGGSVSTKVPHADSRRERNRLAAARSNFKRKVRNQTLRKDLADVQERLAVLRNRERVLREENVRLRLAAGKRKFNVSRLLTHVIT